MATIAAKCFDCEIILNDRWISTKINIIIDCINKLGIGEDFLYDGEKYFRRAYSYKDTNIEDLEDEKYNKCVYEDVFNIRDEFLKKKII